VTVAANDVDVVRAAARAALAARGVRVYRAIAFDVPGGSTVIWSWKIGVADPGARSARVRSFFSDDSPVWKVESAVARRWPWLAADDPAPEPGPQQGGESIEIGRTRYYGDDGRWTDWSDLPLYTPRLALWPLEAILGVSVARHIGHREVRGTQCECYLGVARPGEAAGSADIQLVDAPKPDDEWREVFAEVCVDADGLVRRIAWTPKFGKRRRGGLVRSFASLAGNGPPSTDGAQLPQPWELTELWHFGSDVQIAAPSDVSRDGASLGEIAGDLWRIRRDYKRKLSRQSDGD
jgi:hypothetical protein